MVDARFEEVVTRMQQDSAEVALSAADVLAARALQHAPGAAIDEAIGRVLRQVARGQELLVRVHPDHITEIERMVAIRQGGDRRRLNIQVVADETLPLGDANIEWDQGGLVLDASARAEAIRAELEALLPQA
jgi:flagellar assembly protein FliH